MKSVFFLHDLMDRDPVAYSVTVPTGYNTSYLNQEGLIVHTIKKELFDLGICTIKTSFGNDIKVNNMERTVCDILRDRNNQDIAVVSDAIKRYVRKPNKDLKISEMDQITPRAMEYTLDCYLKKEVLVFWHIILKLFF